MGMATVAVDLYAASTNAQGVSVPASSALASNVTLNITSDTAGNVAGDYHTAAFMVPTGMKPWFDDDGAKGQFVSMAWTFDLRKSSGDYHGTVPSWYGGIAGCLSLTLNQNCIKFVACCPATIGWVPFYSGSPIELSFKNPLLLSFPSSFDFDDRYGAHWQAAVETTMDDPFWQAPFAPDCTGNLDWREDDGSGHADDLGATPPIQYYPARRLVEAISAIPTNYGYSGSDTPGALPAGVNLTFDTGANVLVPPYWATGIPIDSGFTGDDVDGWTSIWRPYGFFQLACADITASGRFSDVYSKFVSC